MKKRLLFAISMGASVCAVSAQDRSLSGDWQIRGQMGQAMACRIEQAGERLTGSCGMPGQASVPLEGKVSGDKVSWTLTSQYNGAPLVMKYDGTLDADSTIAGSSMIERFLISGEFDAVRAGSPAATRPPSFADVFTPCPAGMAKSLRAPASAPDFGPNVLILDPAMPQVEVQCRIDAIAQQQQRGEFGPGRHAILLMPGAYKADIRAAYFTQIAGLGLSPDEVKIDGHVQSLSPGGRSAILVSFWRSVENMAVTPPDGKDYWAVSQAAPYRRMHLRGNLALHRNATGSGGFMADSVIDGTVDGTRQQQWFTRNSAIKGWKGGMWNMVFMGVAGAPASTPPTLERPQVNRFDTPVVTTFAQVPLTREKPFLFADRAGRFGVFVPALRRASRAASWAGGKAAGQAVPISRFFIARPEMSAAQINRALDAGKHLILTPGIYRVDEPIRVKRAGTIVLGMGVATIEPQKGTAGMEVSDVGGVDVSGLLFNAGPVNSEALFMVGPRGAAQDHRANPTFLHDIYARIGDKGPRSATTSVEINSSSVVLDHSWLWRADHAPNIGWDVNVGQHGLVVNGNDVITYGLMVEHYENVQVLWNGERGRTYFYQSEVAANPAWPEATRPGSTMRGYPSYKVADTVRQHEAWGMGAYFFISGGPKVVQARSFEVPQRPGVVLHNIQSLTLAPWGRTEHVVNDFGPAVSQDGVGSPPVFIPRYPPQ